MWHSLLVAKAPVLVPLGRASVVVLVLVREPQELVPELLLLLAAQRLPTPLTLALVLLLPHLRPPRLRPTLQEGAPLH